jgi:hypothetical protein
MLGGCSVVGIRSGTEQPSYEVVETLGERTEIRRYGDLAAAETRVDLDEAPEGEARNRAFERLFNYIQGANRAGGEIAMTAPVETARGGATPDDSGEEIAMTAPVETARGGEGMLRMRFFLPADYSADSAPAPTNLDVEIVSIPQQVFAVRRFSGDRSWPAVEEELAVLRDTLAGSAWTVDGPPVAWFYDPPWTLPFARRNEVALPVSRR